MLKQHSQVINFLMGVCDLAIVGGTWFAAYGIRFHFFHSEGLPAFRSVATNCLLVQLIALIVLAGTGLYKPRRDKSFLLELGQIIKATAIVWVVLIVLIYYTAPGPFARAMLAIFLPLMMAGLVLERASTGPSSDTSVAGAGIFATPSSSARVAWPIDPPPPPTQLLDRHSRRRLHRNTPNPARMSSKAAAPVSAVSPSSASTDTLLETVERMKIDCVFVALPTQQAELLAPRHQPVGGNLRRCADHSRPVPVAIPDERDGR